MNWKLWPVIDTSKCRVMWLHDSWGSTSGCNMPKGQKEWKRNKERRWSLKEVPNLPTSYSQLSILSRHAIPCYKGILNFPKWISTVLSTFWWWGWDFMSHSSPSVPWLFHRSQKSPGEKMENLSLFLLFLILTLFVLIKLDRGSVFCCNVFE